jgi:hypothetical protein
MLLVLKATHHFLHGKKSKLHISYHIWPEQPILFYSRDSLMRFSTLGFFIH